MEDTRRYEGTVEILKAIAHPARLCLNIIGQSRDKIIKKLVNCLFCQE